MFDRDLIVIGGGAGGLVITSVASQLGLKVALIEKESSLGGDCLHYGCVPSKALLKASKVSHLVGRAKEFGVEVSGSKVDLQSVNRSVKDAVDAIQVHDSHERFRSLGAETITGEARFIGRHEIEVDGMSLTAKRIVIATGSRAWTPPIEGLDQVDYLTNEDMFSLNQLPDSMLILGGGPIGIEMAQAYSRLGSKVTIIELAERVLPRSDSQVSATMTGILNSEGIDIRCGQSVRRVSQQDDTKRVELEDGSIVDGDALLVAVGRRPVIDNLGLDDVGIVYSDRGIQVNDKMQTTLRHIYACGDVTGLYPFTHVAEQQAGVIIANMLFRVPKKMRYDNVPSVLYTEPEVAEIGVSADQVEDDNRYDVVRFDMADCDRAIAERETEGFVQLVVNKGRLIGAQIVGPHAGEVIHELALAINKRLKLTDITGMMHAYPSYAQINKRAAGLYFKDALFSQRTKRVVQWLHRWLP